MRASPWRHKDPEYILLVMGADWSGQHSSIAKRSALGFLKAGEQNLPLLCSLLSSPAAPVSHRPPFPLQREWLSENPHFIAPLAESVPLWTRGHGLETPKNTALQKLTAQEAELG